MDSTLRKIEKLIPKPLYEAGQPFYHMFLAWLGAMKYGFPSRKIVVIGITGTKGKTSTAEYMDHILSAAGHKTAVLGTLHFKIGDVDKRNLYKMTMPGRFFVQKFLREAVDAGCDYAIVEMTSEGAKQFRQRFINMDALIFTNLSPEHIERHGSFANYLGAKLSIARTLTRSKKHRRLLIVNGDDAYADAFLRTPRVIGVTFAKHQLQELKGDENGFSFVWNGVIAKGTLPGIFNAYNALAAATCARELGVPTDAIVRGIAQTVQIRGRAERIDNGQPFGVYVDYAHTPDSLVALYETFKEYKIIAVLGNTGGGRDTWKRPEMGGIADKYCEKIILSNEDPYDEDPRGILEQMKTGIMKHDPEIILDRREAITRAFTLAKETERAVVLLTGKGTDPYIMGPHGTKTEWDEATVCREELEKMGYKY